MTTEPKKQTTKGRADYPSNTLLQKFDNDAECLKKTIYRKVMSIDFEMPTGLVKDKKWSKAEEIAKLRDKGVVNSTLEGLKDLIYSQTHVLLSTTSLKRILRMQNDYGPTFRKDTMDTLAHFLGFHNWSEAGPVLPKEVSTSVMFDLDDCYTASSFLPESELTVETEHHRFSLRKLEGSQFEVLSVEGSNYIHLHDILEIPTLYKESHFLVKAIIRDNTALGSYDSGDTIIGIDVTD